MFDDESVTFQLAAMLRTLDITLSVDHMNKLDEEGYLIDDVNECVVESLITQQDELADEIIAHQNMLASDELNVTLRMETISGLVEDLDNFTDRLVEFTS
jgi:hypothetical protein